MKRTALPGLSIFIIRVTAAGCLFWGERYSGKSTLSRTIAAAYFERQNIYQIFPPESGSINPSEFRESFDRSSATGRQL